MELNNLKYYAQMKQGRIMSFLCTRTSCMFVPYNLTSAQPSLNYAKKLSTTLPPLPNKLAIKENSICNYSQDCTD